MNDYRARLFADKPSDWRIDKLGNLFKERAERGYSDLPLLAVTGGSGIVPRDQLNRMDTSSEDKSKYRLLKVGDIAYNTMRLWQGVLGLSHYEGIVSPAYTVLKPQDGVHALFFYYLMKTPWMINSFLRYSSGLCSDTNNCKYESFKLIKTLVPSLPEQRRIAEILGSVDESIDKAEALIAKLQDLKKATMQELLTKGIGHTEFKDSPIGKIPAGWEIRRLREVLSAPPRNGYSPTEATEWTGLVSLGLGCLTQDGFEPIHLKNVNRNDQTASVMLHDGDLLISRSNTRDLVALPGVFREIGIPCIYPDLMMRLTPNATTSSRFIELLLRHHPVRSQLTSGAGGTSGSMVKINSATVLGTVIPLPSELEQGCIIKVVDTQDTALRAQKRNLTELQNLKQALMQDLLTGRVRVRV